MPTNPTTKEAKPILELVDLTIKYGNAATIGPSSLSVNEGEFISLLGPSGCGKTTNLRCIAGFLTPSSGDVRINGESLVRKPPHRRNVGLVFQNYALFPHLSVRNNMAFGPRRKGFPKQEIKTRVDDMIERMGLGGLGDRFPAQLSGGQQQRVALGRALVLEPDVLLLDEPLSNLDRKLRQQLRGELRRVHREFRKTLIYVTHDQEEALSLSDRIVVMMGGQIAQVGTPREIYEKPATASVADFMGECLSLTGRMVDRRPDGYGVVESEGGTRWCVSLDGRSIATGDGVRISMLAGSISPCGPARPVGPNIFSMPIRDVYFTGDKTMLVCVAPGGREIPIGVEPGSPDAGREIGSTIRCYAAPESIHCFAEHTG